MSCAWRAAPAEAWSRPSLAASSTSSRSAIDPEVVDPDDLDDLQDLVVAAVADAQTNAKAAADEKMQRIAGGMGLPPGLGLGGF